MGVIIRQSIQNTIISYVGIVLGFITTILMFPHILEPGQYGLTRLLISLTMVSTQFAHFGMKNVIIRYFPYFQQTERSRYKLLALTFLVPLLGFLLFLVLFFLFQDLLIQYFSDRSTLFSDYNLYLLPLVFAVLFFEVLNSYVRALQDSVTGSFIQEVGLRLLTIVLLGIYYYGLIDFPLFMAGFALIYGLQPIFLVGHLIVQGELSFSKPLKNISARLLKGMGVYAVFSLLGGLATMLVGNIDILMLSALKDLENTAVYAIAFYVGSVIAVPQRSISKIALPVLAGLLRDKNYDEIDRLYKRTSLNQIIAGSLLFVGIWANMHNLIDLLPPEYSGLKWVVIVVGAAKLFNMATGINGGIILNSRFYRFDLYSNIFLVLLTILTNYLLIPPYGILGAAMATALSLFLYNSIKLIFVWIKFSMQPFRWNALAVLLIAGGCLLLSFEIPYLYNFVVDVTVRSGIMAAVFLALILIFGLSDDVKNLVQESLRRIRTFMKR
ncbi:polysaccharide biosynthesis C-terminal domain-containing protein [Aliifodinibius sp. S!AR15-10]|uniref:polysaccharide biosynthesis C-terminal domain-containing protein n=1 Tax=Aliifodinibius sp. S!AR15-10 TaxID=2950437 RepID=UPI00286069EC|nr:polysaccharide biosynthesis C-terminal domain-containing protein [Aliifodinibius sp. S!AR15-10]MDR8394599.1 polysaccharide biosynthesis C-terminal domain-containing protein [Aliifodinibius sp. S!AR15-10]